MKKLSAIAIAAAFVLTSACSFAATSSNTTWDQKVLQKRQQLLDKQNAAIKKQDEKINELANAFMDALPTMMKIRLQAA